MFRDARSASAWLLAAGVCAVLSTGCAPSCDELCNKLTDCALVPSVDQPECVISCDRQLGPLINDTDTTDDEADEATLEVFNAHRTCVGDATCSELQDGACFESSLFPYSQNP